MNIQPRQKFTSFSYLLTICLFFTFHSVSFAGPLKDLEEASTNSGKRSEPIYQSRSSIHNESDNSFEDLLGEIIAEVFNSIFSNDEDEPISYKDYDQDRLISDRDVATQWNFDVRSLFLSDDIDGYEAGLNFQFDEFLVGYDHTYLNDDNSEEKLSFNHLKFGFSYSDNRQAQWITTIGYVAMIGEEPNRKDTHHGGAIGGQLNLSLPGHWMTLEIEPTIYIFGKGANTHSFDIRLNIPEQNLGVQLGYKYWEAQDVTVKGPYLGLNMVW